MNHFPKYVEQAINEYRSGLVLASSDLSLGAISEMVDSKAIDISPDFQRRDRWSVSKQSQLIESFLLNMPVPPVYLFEHEDGTYAVIDGKQRITAINLFMNGKLTLKEMEILRDIEGLNIDSFPASILNGLSVRPYVRTVTILNQSRENISYEVFLRLNRSGVPLSPMEIRKVAFRGLYCDMIFEEAKNEFLYKQLKIKGTASPAYRKMQDAEFVLRFLSLMNTWDNFGSDYRRSMDDHMLAHAGSERSLVEKHRQRFRRALLYCEKIWGDHAFQRPVRPGEWRNFSVAGVYDAQMLAVDRCNDEELELACMNSGIIRELTESAFLQDGRLVKAATAATNNRTNIVYRVDAFIHILRCLNKD
ncbi:MAG: DUF262 domain-containing protein [Phycisphaerales bacterium]